MSNQNYLQRHGTPVDDDEIAVEADVPNPYLFVAIQAHPTQNDTRPSSKYQYRLRNRAQEWFALAEELESWVEERQLRMPNAQILESDYMKLFKFGMDTFLHFETVQGNMDMQTMSDLAPPHLKQQWNDSTREVIDVKDFKVAHRNVVNAWNNLCAILDRICTQEVIKRIFKFDERFAARKQYKLSCLEIWLAETDLKYARLYPDPGYTYYKTLLSHV